MGSYVIGFSIDSLVINSAGKFELIQGKVESTVLKEGVRNDYRTTVFLLGCLDQGLKFRRCHIGCHIRCSNTNHKTNYRSRD
jgi:hypothetical protein